MGNNKQLTKYKLILLYFAALIKSHNMLRRQRSLCGGKKAHEIQVNTIISPDLC